MKMNMNMKNMNMKKGALIMAIAVVLLVLLFAAGKFTSLSTLPALMSKNKNLTIPEAKTVVEKLIKERLVAEGTAFEVGTIVEENGIYKVPVKVNSQDIISYVTKDGKLFFPQAIEVEEKKEAASASAAPEPEEITKSSKPKVDLYVMSFCPYGNKAEDTLKPVYDLLKNKVEFNFHYIVSVNGNDIQSLHGAPEVAQNEREACVLNNYGRDKWMQFVTYVNANCGSDGSCWETGAKNAGLNAASISSCAKSKGVALMKADATASGNAKASGSPTMIINGISTKAVYQYGNSEAYKKIICSAFNTAPEECSKELSSQTSTAQGGSCGN